MNVNLLTTMEPIKVLCYKFDKPQMKNNFLYLKASFLDDHTVSLLYTNGRRNWTSHRYTPLFIITLKKLEWEKSIQWKTLCKFKARMGDFTPSVVVGWKESSWASNEHAKRTNRHLRASWPLSLAKRRKLPWVKKNLYRLKSFL